MEPPEPAQAAMRRMLLWEETVGELCGRARERHLGPPRFAVRLARRIERGTGAFNVTRRPAPAPEPASKEEGGRDSWLGMIGTMTHGPVGLVLGCEYFVFLSRSVEWEERCNYLLAPFNGCSGNV